MRAHVVAAELLLAVHDRVDAGLHAGQVPGEGAGWVVLSIACVEMAAGERALANRLVGR